MFKEDYQFQIVFLSQTVLLAAIMKTLVLIRTAKHYFSGICAFALACAFDITLYLVCAISLVKSGCLCRANYFTCVFPLVIHLRSPIVIKCAITIPVNLPILF